MESSTKEDIPMTDTITQTRDTVSTYVQQEVARLEALFAEELTLNHRCDGCSAAAVSQVIVPDLNTVLMFCGHHWRKNMHAVREKHYLYRVPEEHDYQFTDREIAARPRSNAARDGGSA